MRLLFTTFFASGAVFLSAPSGDITVAPERVEPGGLVTVKLACDVFSEASADSDAFGKLAVPGKRGASIQVTTEPGKYRVEGRCAPDANPLNDGWLVVEAAYPSGGAGTGDGATHLRAVGPAFSLGVGVLAAAVLLLLVRRARR
ncbi:hypothetical protein [Nonomuraea typhae]|uniref:Sortase n=1 Tax=Nonomuraea typhae TaxID=2603600 RepID=A0ABW7YXF6_9ACTN